MAEEPAVSDDGPGVGGVHHVDPADKLEEGGGVLGHPVVRPGGELELLHLPPVRVPHLGASKSLTAVNLIK